MNKFFYFIAVGLAFTALQVATATAAHVDCADPAKAADPECIAAAGAGAGDGGVALTIGDPVCAVSPPAPGCPPGSPGFAGDPPGDGGTAGMAPPMCAGPLDTMIPCPPPGGDGDACADKETPALVAACVREKESHPAP